MSTQNKSPKIQQRGIALVVALVLLVIVTLLGLAAIRGTSLQEKMAGNSYDREIGFQAAEAALNVAANTISTNAASLSFTTAGLDCTDYSVVCPDNPNNDATLNGAWVSVPVGTAATNFTAFTSTNPPQYIIQKVVCPPSAGGAGTGGVSTAIDQVGDLTSQINGSGTCYRATARSLDPAAAGNNNRAIVLLQSTFRS